MVSRRIAAALGVHLFLAHRRHRRCGTIPHWSPNRIATMASASTTRDGFAEELARRLGIGPEFRDHCL